MADTEIVCRKHGPLSISGEFELKDAAGKVFDLSGRKVIALCRCGQSENKPFCDGSHQRVEFDSEVTARKI